MSPAKPGETSVPNNAENRSRSAQQNPVVPHTSFIDGLYNRSEETAHYWKNQTDGFSFLLFQSQPNGIEDIIRGSNRLFDFFGTFW